MAEKKDKPAGRGAPGKNRMPDDSLFFERIVPILLVGLGLVMLILIVVAAGILLGFVPFR